MNKDTHTGWIKMHRSLLDWEWWSDRNTRDLFIYLLLTANHDDTRWRGLTIQRGQLVTSIRDLALKSGLSVQQTRTSLKRLISTHELTQQATQQHTIITISNYDMYQHNENEADTTSNTDDNTQPTHDQHTTNTQSTHNKNDKNVRNILERDIPPYNPPTGDDNAAVTTSSRFVAPTLDEVADYCASRNNGIDPEAFLAHYESVGWMRGRTHIKDWRKCVITWERNRKNDAQPSHPTIQTTPTTQTTKQSKNPLAVPSELERARANFKF